MDVSNAFLYEDLSEIVYMEQPPGYVAQREKVCKLKKAIYGLKQSPRAQFDKFCQVVNKIGFRCSKSDHSIFVKQTSFGWVVLAVYVNDILLTGSDHDEVVRVKEHLENYFITKNLGKP